MHAATAYICVTCGVQHAPSAGPPDRCAICDDGRQYVGWEGQRWTSLDELRVNHNNRIEEQEPDLTGIGTRPDFAIAQRALLVRTPEGNLLWDCISLLDGATTAAVRNLGGIAAIAISHPHYHSSMVEWSHEFGAPIHLHEADRRWVMRPDPAIRYWSGETFQLFGGLTVVRCGGHFPGATIVHWPAGAEGRGALLTGDVVTVAADRRYVSFMYSYPNVIPLPAHIVRRIADKVGGYRFDRIYGAWWGRVVRSDARAAVERSADRYIAALTTEAAELDDL